MAENRSTPPGNWPDLLAYLRAIPRSHAEHFLIFINQAKDMEPADPRLVGPLLGATDVLARGVVMGQGPLMKTPIAVLKERANEVRDADDHLMAQSPLLQLATLGSVVISEASGRGVWDGVRDAVLPRLFKGNVPNLSTLTKCVWACLAWGHKDVATALLQQGVDASAAFGKTKVSAVQYALANDGPRNAIDVYLHDFPSLLAQEEAGWCELLWAARTQYVVAEGGDGGTLVEWLMSKVEDG